MTVGWDRGVARSPVKGLPSGRLRPALETCDLRAAQLSGHLVACAYFAIDHGDDWEPIVMRFVKPLGSEGSKQVAAGIREKVD